MENLLIMVSVPLMTDTQGFIVLSFIYDIGGPTIQ